RDVHVAQFEADIVFRAKDVYPECCVVHEVYGVCSGGDVVVREQHSAGEFQIRRDATMVLEIPFESKWIEADAVGGIGRLENEEERNGIDRILESTAQKTGKVRAGQHPSVAQPGIEESCIATPAAYGVSAASPDLDLAAA